MHSFLSFIASAAFTGRIKVHGWIKQSATMNFSEMLCYGSKSYHSKTIETLRWRLLYIHQFCRSTKPDQKRSNFQCGLHCFRRFGRWIQIRIGFSRRVCNPHDITDCRKLLQNWFVFGLQQMLAHIKLNNRFDESLMQQPQQLKERGRTSFSKLKRNCQRVLVDLAQSDPRWCFSNTNQYQLPSIEFCIG